MQHYTVLLKTKKQNHKIVLIITWIVNIKYNY